MKKNYAPTKTETPKMSFVEYVDYVMNGRYRMRSIIYRNEMDALSGAAADVGFSGRRETERQAEEALSRGELERAKVIAHIPQKNGFMYGFFTGGRSELGEDEGKVALLKSKTDYRKFRKRIDVLMENAQDLEADGLKKDAEHLYKDAKFMERRIRGTEGSIMDIDVGVYRIGNPWLHKGKGVEGMENLMRQLDEYEKKDGSHLHLREIDVGLEPRSGGYRAWVVNPQNWMAMPVLKCDYVHG